jgi:outer membrane protein insertion porin family
MRRTSPFLVILASALLCLAVWGPAAAVAEEEPSTGVVAVETELEPVAEPGEQVGEVAVEPSQEDATPSEEIVAEPTPQTEALGGAPAEPAEEEDALLDVPAPIVSVEVVGNEHVATDTILKAIKSEAGGQFSEGQVALDRKAVLNLGWFWRVSVDRESVENGVRLVFHVVENPVIGEIQFQGNKELTRDDLLAVMETKPGQVYSAPLLVRDAEAIQDVYGSKGYILAMVLEPSMSEEGVLTLVIAEGEIEEIKITGNTHTKTYAIRRYIRTKAGEAYNDRQVTRDVAKLTSLGWFETVRRDAEVGTEPGKVIVVITVVEKRRTGTVSVGGGYSSVQGLVGFVDLTKSNLAGNGQAVSIRGEFGGQTSYEFGYQHPWVMTPETRLSLGIYDRLILREAFVTDNLGERRSILYDERRNGGNFTLGRPISEATTVFVGMRADDVSISGLTEEEEGYLTGAAFEPRKVRSITLAAVNDTRSNLYNPRSGAYQRLSAEFAGLIFGGTEFNKYVLDTRRFFRMGAKNTVAMRLLVGTVSGDPPYLEQFLIGGSETLRGYRTDRFVGTRMGIVNTEYRIPIGENLLGVLFVDVGDAWGGPMVSDPAFEDIVHDSFTAHVGYGVGVRVNTPIGPLRLDLGFSEEGTETHFGVRNAF